MKTCGNCSLCCKLLGVADIKKPAGQWCGHFKKGQGCTIHAELSLESICRQFSCFWLMSSELPDSLKPNECRVVIAASSDGGVIAYVDRNQPDAWRRPDILGALETLALSNRSVTIITGEKVQKLYRKGNESDQVLDRIEEIDQVFETATGWGSWMVSAGNERKGLVRKLKSLGISVGDRWLPRTSDNHPVD